MRWLIFILWVFMEKFAKMLLCFFCFDLDFVLLSFPILNNVLLIPKKRERERERTPTRYNGWYKQIRFRSMVKTFVPSLKPCIIPHNTSVTMRWINQTTGNTFYRYISNSSSFGSKKNILAYFSHCCRFQSTFNKNKSEKRFI